MESPSDNCVFCRFAEKRPDSLIGRVWKWHTGWCPRWKEYREAEKQDMGTRDSES